MLEHLKVDTELRDKKWEDDFLEKLKTCSLDLLQDHPIQGPDGMPYLPVNIVEKGEPSLAVLKWLAEGGVGLVVSPEKKPPDFVLPFGMIWNFFLTGKFIESSSVDSTSGEFELKPEQEFFAGVPSESFFPNEIRKIFKEFLKDQKVNNPKILMVSMDKVQFDLCFSWESLGEPPQEEWNGILEGFSWFFPMHYSFSILSEKSILGFDFIDL